MRVIANKDRSVGRRQLGNVVVACGKAVDNNVTIVVDRCGLAIDGRFGSFAVHELDFDQARGGRVVLVRNREPIGAVHEGVVTSGLAIVELHLLAQLERTHGIIVGNGGLCLSRRSS